MISNARHGSSFRRPLRLSPTRFRLLHIAMHRPAIEKSIRSGTNRVARRKRREIEGKTFRRLGFSKRDLSPSKSTSTSSTLTKKVSPRRFSTRIPSLKSHVRDKQKISKRNEYINPGPGTSFKAVPRTSQGMPSQSVRWSRNEFSQIIKYKYLIL